MVAHIQSPRWKLSELLSEAGVCAVSPDACRDAIITGLSADSRCVGPGTLFVAVTGAKVDGHAYVAQALADGASVAIVEPGRCRHADGRLVDDRVVEIADTRGAVSRLAAAFFGITRAQREGRLALAAVTGTNGKTTVCTLLQSILSAAGFRAASLTTIASDLVSHREPSDMTTLEPVELCRRLGRALDAGATHAVVEVSSHALDQRRCGGLDFSVAVQTNLTQDHFDYHGGLANYTRAKKRLFDGLGADSVAVVNADDDHWKKITRDTKARIVRCGLNARDLDVWVDGLSINTEGSTFHLCAGTRRVEIHTSLLGRHNVRNILCAAAAAAAMGVDLAAIKQGVQQAVGVPGRLQRVGSADAPFSVLVDYAHTPDALQSVLTALGELKPKRLICVFGCGGDRDRDKRPKMGRIVGRLADQAVVTSDNPRGEDPGAIIDRVLEGLAGQTRCHVAVDTDRRRAIYSAVRSARRGDIVLIAGKGHEKYQMIANTRLPFDDVHVASEAISQACEAMSQVHDKVAQEREVVA